MLVWGVVAFLSSTAAFIMINDLINKLGGYSVLSEDLSGIKGESNADKTKIRQKKAVQRMFGNNVAIQIGAFGGFVYSVSFPTLWLFC